MNDTNSERERVIELTEYSERTLVPNTHNTNNTNNSPLQYLNDIEWWPVWIGLAWYLTTMVVRVVWETGPVKIPVWRGVSEISLWFHNFQNITRILLMWSTTVIALYSCHKFTKTKFSLISYIVLFLLTSFSQIIGSFAPTRSIGMGTSIFCILFGCIFRNATGLVVPNVMSLETFIKIAIVVLATDINPILGLGAGGLAVAWLETSIILVITFAIGKFVVRADTETSLLIASGVSICGSSAIMAVADVIRCSKQRVTDSVTVISLFVIPFIPTVPLVLQTAFQFTDVTIGATIGGSIDSTGAVVASASILNNTNVLYTAVVTKMLQNIFIGPVTMCIATVWYRTLDPRLLWQRFPKFVIGFIVVCCITTIVGSSDPILRDHVISDCLIVSEWFSNLSFVLIGMDIDFYQLAVNFRQLSQMTILYLIGQTLDVVTTTITAFLVFETV